MLAAAATDPSTAPRPRRGLTAAPVRDGEPTTSVTVTVQIDLRGEVLPPAAIGLLASLRALAGPAGVTSAPATDAAPRRLDEPGGPRPRLVRQSEPAGPGPSLRVFLASRMVLLDGAPVRLTRREYDLLTFLCQHPGRVFGRGQLLRQVWGYEMVSGERTVDVHVRRLRVKLGDRGPVIATMRGVGYRLDDAAQVVLVTDAR